jgi:hypothetical protein
MKLLRLTMFHYIEDQPEIAAHTVRYCLFTRVYRLDFIRYPPALRKTLKNYDPCT